MGKVNEVDTCPSIHMFDLWKYSVDFDETWKGGLHKKVGKFNFGLYWFSVKLSHFSQKWLIYNKKHRYY